MSRENMTRWLLRIGLAFVFLYAAIMGFLEPSSWIGFIPIWLRDALPIADEIILIGLGVVEIIIAALILFQRRPFVPALVGAVLLGSMVIFNFGALDILFRDIGLFFMALSLAVLSK